MKHYLIPAADPAMFSELLMEFLENTDINIHDVKYMHSAIIDSDNYSEYRYSALVLYEDCE